MDKLIENLTKLSAEELDALLDRRDSRQFDCAWCELNESVPDPVHRFDTKEIFMRVSKATNAHEICSYISDDLELIYKLEKAGVESKFLSYLKACYEQGVVPCEWLS